MRPAHATQVYDFDVLSFNDPIGSLSVPLFDLMRQRVEITGNVMGRRHVAQLHFTDVPLQGVSSGTISFSVSFELKLVVGLLPGTPVHASAAQALRRPPPKDASCIERARDRLLIALGHQIFLYIAILWLLALCGFGAFAAITFGALFIPQIMVAFSGIMRNEPADMSLAEDWYAVGLSDDQLEYWANVCVHVLTGLFSYFNTLTLPWRLSILYHLCSRRSDAPGRDFYGRSTEAIWFQIPRRARAYITFFLLASTVSHFATQTSRFVYPSFESSNAWPGVIICNVTFGGAIVFGVIAGIKQSIEERKLVKKHPDRYPPTIWSHIHELRKRGEFSCLALLCCRLGSSHEEARERWFLEKEIQKLSKKGTPATRRSEVFPSDRSPPSARGPRSEEAGAELWPADAPMATPSKVDAELPVLEGHYTTDGPQIELAPSYLSMQLAHLMAQRQQRADLATTDGGLSLPSTDPHYLVQQHFAQQMSTQPGVLGGMPFVGRALQLVPLERHAAQETLGLRGPAGEALLREFEYRGADREAKYRLEIEARDRLLHARSGELLVLQHEIEKLQAAAAEAAAMAADAPADEAANTPANAPADAPAGAATETGADVLTETAAQEASAEERETVHFVSGTSFGISITTDESGRPSVTKVVPGSAADAQGCKVGNALIDVDGKSTIGLTQSEVLEMITAAMGEGEGVTRTLTFVKPQQEHVDDAAAAAAMERFYEGQH